MGQPQRALEVDLDDPVPELLVGLDERLEVVPAGVVDEHVDFSELGPHLRDPGRDAGAVGHVEPDAERSVAGRTDRLSGLLSSGAVEVGDRDGTAVGRQRVDDRTADPARAAGDQGDPGARMISIRLHWREPRLRTGTFSPPTRILRLSLGRQAPLSATRLTTRYGSGVHRRAAVPAGIDPRNGRTRGPARAGPRVGARPRRA